MNITQLYAKLKLHGPIQHIDFAIDKATFTNSPDLFYEYGDIVRVKSSIRESDTCLKYCADRVKRVLIETRSLYPPGSLNPSLLP